MNPETIAQNILSWEPRQGIAELLQLLTLLGASTPNPETLIAAADIAQHPLGRTPLRGIWGVDIAGLGLQKEPGWAFRVVPVRGLQTNQFLANKTERRIEQMEKDAKIIIRLPAEIRRQLRIYCAENGVSLQSVVEKMIEELLAEPRQQ